MPRRSWRPSWFILALSWTMLGNLVAILEQLCDCSIGESVSLDRFGFEKMRIAKNLVKHDENGPKMAPRWCEDGAMLAHVGALGRYLGPSWRSRAPSCRQVVARLRQDGPTWRPNEPENAPTQRKAERSEACPPFTQAHRTLLKDMHERTKRISLNSSEEASGCSL